MLVLVPIVEGQGEIQAVPKLLHRLARQAAPDILLKVNHPIRVKSGSFLNDEDYFCRQVRLATAKAAQSGGHVLILLDCDDDCPATLGPELLRRARAVRDDVDIGVFLAYREYETWFIAAAESLRGIGGLPNDLVAPDNPEHFRGAKGWLSQRMPRPYDPVVHQLEFTQTFDLDRATSNDSFRRLHAYVHRLSAP